MSENNESNTAIDKRRFAEMPEDVRRKGNEAQRLIAEEYRQRLGERIVRMYEDGNSFHKIAKALAAEGETTSRGNPMSRNVVRNIYLKLHEEKQ